MQHARITSTNVIRSCPKWGYATICLGGAGQRRCQNKASCSGPPAGDGGERGCQKRRSHPSWLLLSGTKTPRSYRDTPISFPSRARVSVPLTSWRSAGTTMHANLEVLLPERRSLACMCKGVITHAFSTVTHSHRTNQSGHQNSNIISQITKLLRYASLPNEQKVARFVLPSRRP